MTLVGDLVATIRLDGASQFVNDAAGAKQALDRVSTSGGNLGRAVDAGMRVAGAAVNTTIGLITALGTTAVLSGGKFNILQQNAGVALKTLMGSSEAARQQMVRLNDFANNSPFGRDTFIKAQQNMIAFGIEADKVVPYLDAIQNQVAGIGGSDANIGALVTTISKIRSSATFGQQDLLELSNQGVNAAALIASEMGITEQEFRDSIFGSPLKGEAALAGLDSMMTAMQTKFGGTTAALKQQFDGARDRIRASIRDIGADMTREFISPEGGGWAVRWANSTADVLRAFQSSLRPIWGDLMAQAQPAFVAIESGLQRMKSAALGLDMADIRATFERLSPILPVVAGGLAAVSTSALAAIPGIGGLLGGLNPLTAAVLAAASASPELRESLGDLMGALKPLAAPAADVAKILAGTLTVGLQTVAGVLTAVTPAVEALSKMVAGVPAPLLAAAAAVGVAVVAFRGLSTAMTAMNAGQATGGFMTAFAASTKVASDGAVAFGKSISDMAGTAQRAYSAGLSPATAALAGVAPVAGAAATGITGVGTALKTAFLSNPIGMIIMGVTTAISLFAIASADAAQKTADYKARVEELRGTLNATTSGITEQTRAAVLSSFQASEWSSRVSELNTGLWTLADMTLAATGESDALTNQLADLAGAQVDWNGSVKTGSVTSREWSKVLADLGMSSRDLVLEYHKGGDALQAMKDKLVAANYSAEEADELFTNLGNSLQGINSDALRAIAEEAGKIDAARQLHAEYNREIERLRTAGGDAAVAQRKLSDALSVVADATSDANSKLRAYRDILDLLAGGTLSAAEAQARLHEASFRVEDAFKAATDEAGAFNAALIKADGSIDTSTQQGLDLYNSLKGVADSAIIAASGVAEFERQNGNAAGAGQAAAGVIQEYADSIRAAAEAAGWSGPMVDALIEKLGLVPDKAEIVFGIDGTDKVNVELGNIALQLSQLEGEDVSIQVHTLSEDARTKLDQLGFTVNELVDGQWVISMGGDYSEGEARLNELLNLVSGSSATATIDGDATNATNALNSFLGVTDKSSATSTVNANATNAYNSVNSFVEYTNRSGGTSWVYANASQAHGELWAFTQAVRNADPTVFVHADVSAALNAIASLSNRSIGVAVNPRANGGLDSYNGMQSFANGGFPTGIYRGGPPIYKFAEPETGWELFASGRRGQEHRNLRLVREAERRLLAQLGMGQRVQAFANGGGVSYSGDNTAASMPGEFRGAIYLDGRKLVGEFRASMEQVATGVVAADRRDRARTAAHGRRKEH